MFTGIITEVGTVSSVAPGKDGLGLRLDAPSTAAGLPIGGSVAVDGVCLTATAVDRRGFSATVIPETSQRSTLNPRWLGGKGRRVNLERPLTASGELAGHIVQGHVDARARVVALKRMSKEVVLELELPEILQGLVIEKGSIAVNGVSLTVASLSKRRGRSGDRFTVALIPHTLEATNLGELEAGDPVNLEADILGKYVKALIDRGREGRRRER